MSAVTVTTVTGSGVHGIIRELRDMEQRVVPRSIAAALNATNRKIRTRLVREMVSREGLKPGQFRRRIVIPRNKQANPRRLRAGGVARLAFTPLSWYPAKAETSTGVRAGKHHVAGAFLAKRRVSKGRGRAAFTRRARPRLPIQEATVDLTVAVEKAIGKVLPGYAAAEFEREFSRSLSLFLTRAGFR